MDHPELTLAVEADGIALLTINRPAKRNALDSGLLRAIDNAAGEIESNPAARAVLVTGAGEKAFVAGADIEEIAALDGPAACEFSQLGQRAFRRLEGLRKPVAAAINGFALGGGLELALACHLRVACPEAKLGLPEAKLGIIPGFGGTQRLPRLIGRSRALDLLLTGDVVDATRAHSIGLVDHVVARTQLLDFTRGWLRRALANGPLSISAILRAVDAGSAMPLDQALEHESTAFGLIRATADCTEGLRAFLEKRPAEFKAS